MLARHILPQRSWLATIHVRNGRRAHREDFGRGGVRLLPVSARFRHVDGELARFRVSRPGQSISREGRVFADGALPLAGARLVRR